MFIFEYLAFLVSICKDLQAVSGDCQKLDIGISQQCHHLLESSSQAHCHLCPFLMQQQIVERGDGVEQHTIHWRAGGKKIYKKTRLQPKTPFQIQNTHNYVTFLYKVHVLVTTGSIHRSHLWVQRCCQDDLESSIGLKLARS